MKGIIENNFISREKNYDLLRIFSLFAVIIMHVSSSFLRNQLSDTKQLFSNYLIINFWNSLSQISVPCFVMLSGAFLLDKDANMDYTTFYKKSIISIGIPVLLFSFIYFLFEELSIIGKSVANNEVGIKIFLIPIVNWIKGAPYYHLWYMYMILGVYILVPFIIMIKQKIGIENFKKASLILLVVSVFSAITHTSLLYWDVGSVMYYISYLMMGYSLKKIFKEKKVMLMLSDILYVA